MHPSNENDALDVEALPDEKILDYALTRSAMHGDYKAKWDIQSIPKQILGKAVRKGVLLCPNQKLSAPGPVVVWYPVKAIAWNPDVPNAVDIMRAQLGQMVKDDAYPTEILVWDSEGKALTNKIVPPGPYQDWGVPW